MLSLFFSFVVTDDWLIGYWLWLVFGYSFRVFGFGFLGGWVGGWVLEWLVVVGCWSFVVGCGLVVVGCWFLVVGCGLVVVGCWLLVVDCWLLLVCRLVGGSGGGGGGGGCGFRCWFVFVCLFLLATYLVLTVCLLFFFLAVLALKQKNIGRGKNYCWEILFHFRRRS